MSTWPGIFLFGTFSSAALSESRIFFAFSPSSSPSNSFPTLLIHSAFLLCSLRSSILLQIVFFFVIRLLGMSSCILHQPVFGMSCFVYIVLTCLDIILFFLLSLVFSYLFPRVVLFLLLIGLFFFSFSSKCVLAFFLCFIIFCMLQISYLHFQSNFLSSF